MGRRVLGLRTKPKMPSCFVVVVVVCLVGVFPFLHHNFSFRLLVQRQRKPLPIASVTAGRQSSYIHLFIFPPLPLSLLFLFFFFTSPQAKTPSLFLHSSLPRTAMSIIYDLQYLLHQCPPIRSPPSFWWKFCIAEDGGVCVVKASDRSK